MKIVSYLLIFIMCRLSLEFILFCWVKFDVHYFNLLVDSIVFHHLEFAACVWVFSLFSDVLKMISMNPDSFFLLAVFFSSTAKKVLPSSTVYRPCTACIRITSRVAYILVFHFYLRRKMRGA